MIELQENTIYLLKNGMKRTIWRTKESGKFFLLVPSLGIINFNIDGSVIDKEKYSKFEVVSEVVLEEKKEDVSEENSIAEIPKDNIEETKNDLTDWMS